MRLPHPRELPRRPNHVPTSGLVLLAIPVGFAGMVIICEALYEPKQHQILQTAMRTTKDPVDLELDQEKITRHLNFTPVKCRGRFDYENQVLITERNKKTGFENWFKSLLFKDNYTLDDTVLFQTEAGHFVVTPFILSNGKGKILVNRGWIPKYGYDVSKEVKINHEVEISGIIRTASEKPTLKQRFTNDPKNGRWSYRDIQGMSKELDTLPVFIDVDKNTSLMFNRGPIGGQTHLEVANNYKELEVFAFIMCFATLYFWYSKYIGPVRPSHYRPGI